MKTFFKGAFLLVMLAVASIQVQAQVNQVVVIEEMKLNNPGQMTEYLASLKQNWVKVAQEAKSRGLVTDYKVMVRPNTRNNESYDVALHLVFASADKQFQYEAQLKEIMAAALPSGIVAVDGKRPQDLATRTGRHVNAELSTTSL